LEVPGSWKVVLVLSGPQNGRAQVAVVGPQLMSEETTWQGLGGSILKCNLGLLNEESPWHNPGFFSWEGANGKHV